jgi:protein phosphatase
MTLELRFAARSDVGMVRQGNEDSGYAGPHLLVIADGMGGHAFGEVASTAAMRVLVELEAMPADTTDPVAQVRDHLARAGGVLRDLVKDRPELEGMGTTVTLLLQVGDRAVIAQVGDSRGYLLRDGVLEQLTHDQTFVQSLIDEGRISHDAARTHPQRNLLLQSLDGRFEVEPDISVRSPQVGDRYLLCSDGLSNVLSEATMREVLMEGTPDEAADRLVSLALRGGAPDNVTCVVADVEETEDVEESGYEPEPPQLVGAAAEAGEVARVTAAAPKDAPGGSGSGVSGGSEDPADAGDSADGADTPGPRRRFGFRHLLPFLLLAAVAVAAVLGYRWTQEQYYVGASHGQVAIYKGVPQHLAGHRLSRVVESSEMAVTDLPTYAQDQVKATISAKNLGDAHQILANLRAAAATCTTYPEPDGCAPGLATTPSPTPTVTPSTTGSPKASASASTP